MNLTDTVKYLKCHNFVPSKKMGQNFLINDDISHKITNSINGNEYDCIVEIGPGLGALTQHLIKYKKPIIAVEIDKRLSDFIHRTYPQIKLVNNDVLKLDWDQLLEQYTHVALISNLPYAISSLVLNQFIKTRHFIRAWFMLQKEMVQRITGKAGTKQYNGFTVFIQHHTDINKLMDVSKNNFFPIPEVDSVVVEMIKNEQSYNAKFEYFLKMAFASRRKTIVNNLNKLYTTQNILCALKQFSLPTTIRAEAINADVLFDIFNRLSDNTECFLSTH